MVTHTDWQERVHEEIRRKYGLDAAPDFADMSVLPLTEAFILETMRHSCIFPFALPHSTTKDTEINGHFVKAKTLVFVNLWSVSHDPELFLDPGTFDPARFLDGSGSQIDRSKAELFLPFGVGKRRCPGENLAKMELFLFFTVLVQTCRFLPVEGEVPVIDSKYGLTLKPLDFNVVVSKRT